jgi:hypothetical protein
LRVEQHRVGDQQDEGYQQRLAWSLTQHRSQRM